VSNQKTLQEVIAFAANELRTTFIRNAVIEANTSSAYLTVRRTFAVEGTVSVMFEVCPPAKKGGTFTYKPKVSVNFPACNKDALKGAAFMFLVNELVPLAVSLQTQLDEFEISE
jgi:hypothetical protein